MRILCATDLLRKSEAAIQRAGLLSNQLNADLSLLHVVSPGKSHQDLEQTLRSAVARTRSRAKPLLWSTDRKAEVAVRVGNPARIILETAAQSQAGLLVLGSHRKRPLRDALEGTIAEKALATRKHPVLVVRDEVLKPYRRILLALDLTDASVSAIRAAESLVIKPEVRTVVVHAHNPPYRDMLNITGVGANAAERYLREWKREAACTIRALLRLESDDAERYHIHIEQKHTTPGILQSIERFSPDLIVMGTHGGGRLRRAVVGSVANRVLQETDCDALIVPEGSFGAARSELVNGARRARRAGSESWRSPENRAQ
jgi:nucleotide-binding universal stress UspA family protein